jgi:PPOX class probable FMN-dependent enzyme
VIVETIQDLQQLRSIVGEPSEMTQNKMYDHLNEQATDFISRSPFLVLSTVDAEGMPTSSPKGDVPGFVYQADAHTLYMPERRGNKLVVSYQNILATQKVGLIFLLPRCSETLRVSGRAELVMDKELCKKLDSRGPAILLLKVTVTEAYFHCGKAFIRSNLWSPEHWPDESRVSFGREIGNQIGKGTDFVEDLDAQVLERYKDSL